jgi:hypothetical protein
MDEAELLKTNRADLGHVESYFTDAELSPSRKCPARAILASLANDVVQAEI